MSNAGFGKMFVNAILGAIAGQWVATIKSEIEIAKVEFKVKSRELGKGALLVGMALAFGFFMLGVLIAGAVMALATVFEGWVAALIVAGGLFFWVVVLGWWGAYKIKKNSDLVPTSSIERIKKQL